MPASSRARAARTTEGAATSPAGSPPPWWPPVRLPSRCWPGMACGWVPTSAPATAVTDASLEDEEALRAVAAKPFPVLDDAKGEGDAPGHPGGQERGGQRGRRRGVRRVRPARRAGGPRLRLQRGGHLLPSICLPSPPSRGWTSARGWPFSLMRGSEANDPFEVRDGKVVTKTNHAGGVNGGITNGMPITFEATIRPTPSIALPQESVGSPHRRGDGDRDPRRHDPCIVPRAVPGDRGGGGPGRLPGVGHLTAPHGRVACRAAIHGGRVAQTAEMRREKTMNELEQYRRRSTALTGSW